MYSAQEIADYIIQNYANKNENKGDISKEISNLKLQKLLYFAQGLYLAETGTPLFAEDIIAWRYGPVVPEVYRAFRWYVADAITEPSSNEVIDLNSDPRAKMVIEKVMKEYGSKFPGELVRITHAQDPWKNANLDSLIPKWNIRKYFEDHGL